MAPRPTWRPKCGGKPASPAGGPGKGPVGWRAGVLDFIAHFFSPRGGGEGSKLRRAQAAAGTGTGAGGAAAVPEQTARGAWPLLCHHVARQWAWPCRTAQWQHGQRELTEALPVFLARGYKRGAPLSHKYEGIQGRTEPESGPLIPHMNLPNPGLPPGLRVCRTDPKS